MKCVHRGFPNTEISGTALFAAKIWLGKHPNHHRLKTFFFAGKDIPLLLYSIEVATHKSVFKESHPKNRNTKSYLSEKLNHNEKIRFIHAHDASPVLILQNWRKSALPSGRFRRTDVNNTSLAIAQAPCRRQSFHHRDEQFNACHRHAI